MPFSTIKPGRYFGKANEAEPNQDTILAVFIETSNILHFLHVFIRQKFRKSKTLARISFKTKSILCSVNRKFKSVHKLY